VDILDDMGVRKLSASVFLKVNYSFNYWVIAIVCIHIQVWDNVVSSGDY